MTTLTLNYHNSIKKLVSQGMKEPVAETIIEAIQQSREFDATQLVTKDFLKAEIADIRKDMSKLELRLVCWLLGISITGFSTMTYILFTALKFYLTKDIGLPN